MSVRRGYLGAAYYGTAGTNPSTLLLSRIVSVTPDNAMDKIPANDRSNPERNVNLPGRKNGSVDIEFNWDDADAGLIALRDAYRDKTLIALKFLDVAGGDGWYADCYVFNWSRSEPDSGLMTVSINVEIFQGYTEV